MAKSKAELVDEAATLGIELDPKATSAEIQALINNKQMTDEAPSLNDAEGENDTPVEDIEPKVAKAGKRSAKALAEADEEAARQARKDEDVEKPKGEAPKVRTRLERRGKGFRKNAEQIDFTKAYTLEEAVNLAQKTSHVKFDATVEFHINLGVNPRHADQNIRDNLVLPAGTGKTVKIAVLTDDAKTATDAGADIAGTDELLEQLGKGVMDFDILISTPALMPKLGKFARALGPRGLMPNPKSGTVTTDVAKAVAEAKAGRVEYRVDSTGIVHLGVGKVSFTSAQLLQNINAVVASIKSNKPQSVKGNYVKAVHLTTSMGPSITVDVAQLG